MSAVPTLRTTYKRKKRNILDLYSVEGEGGYLNLEYTFMFKSSAFFSDEIKPNVLDIASDRGSFKTINILGSNYTYTDNILRIILGNNNKCILYRNGDVDINGSRSNFAYLKTISPFVRDIFGPSTYRGAPSCYKQLLLLNNGELIEVNVKSQTNKLLLTNVDEFLAKNQAHRGDCLLSMKDKTLRYIYLESDPTTVLTVGGITSDQIAFTSLGDAAATYLIGKKNDKKNLYRFDTTTNWFPTSLQTKPIAGMTLPEGEYYIDGISSETFSVFITNKRLITRLTSPTLRNQAKWYDEPTWDKTSWDITSPAPFKKIITPTAYSVIIEDIYGKYWFLNGRTTYTNGGPDIDYYNLAKPIKYEYFDKLKTYLDPIRKAIR